MTWYGYGGPRSYMGHPWPDATMDAPSVWAKCDYCARMQQRPNDNGCVSCGAPLPTKQGREKGRIEVTSFSDPAPRFVDGW